MDGGLDSLATILVIQEEGAPLGAQPTATSTMKKLGGEVGILWTCE